MDDASYGEMQRIVRDREVALVQRPIKPSLSPGGVKKYDLNHARKIHEFLGKGLVPDAGKVVEARRQSIEISAKKVYRGLYTDRAISLGTKRAELARVLAVHWKQVHELGAFRKLGFEAQRVQMQQLLLSRGLEMEMTNRQRLDLQQRLERGLDISRNIHRSLSTTPELVASKNLSLTYVMSRGYTLGRTAEKAMRTEIVKAAEMAKVRAIEAQRVKAQTVSLTKSPLHLERRMEREALKAAELARRLSFERSRALVEGKHLGPALEMSPAMKAAQERYLALQPELSPGQRLALERANAEEKKSIEKALEMVRRVAPEAAKTMEKKLAQEQSLAMRPPTSEEALKKTQQISRGLRPY